MREREERERRLKYVQNKSLFCQSSMFFARLNNHVSVYSWKWVTLVTWAVECISFVPPCTG